MNLIFFCILLTFNPAETFYCDCEEFIDFDKASEVFIGIVTKIEYQEGSDELRITLKIKETYKQSDLKLEQNKSFDLISSITVCGYNWNAAGEYLVFVEKTNKGKRVVNMCSLTTEIKYQHDDNGNWVGIPTLSEVLKWGINKEIRKKWEKD
ncbi:MAG: hypothetical protein DWQ02_27640 [Bacteroidetes bacterium]|nr:MAG: hypothetical protein DWQ02_27640 [Bacteroidota bacterium]